MARVLSRFHFHHKHMQMQPRILSLLVKMWSLILCAYTLLRVPNGWIRCKDRTCRQASTRCEDQTCCQAWTRCKDYDLLQVLVQFALRDALSDMLDFCYFCTVHYFFVISMAPWSSAARPGCIPLERREAVRASMYRAAVASIETLDSAAAQ